MDLKRENTTLSFSCDDCDDDFECKMCNLSYSVSLQFDSDYMPVLDITIKTIGMSLLSLNHPISVKIF